MGVLKLGTVNGASALGMESQLGTLSVGKQAAISCVINDDLDVNQSPAEIDDWMFAAKSRCEPVTCS